MVQSAEWTPRTGHSVVVFGDDVVVLGGHGVSESTMAREVLLDRNHGDEWKVKAVHESISL
jgi:hypothetical protein